jgi:hypothetical protein
MRALRQALLFAGLVTATAQGVVIEPPPLSGESHEAVGAASSSSPILPISLVTSPPSTTRPISLEHERIVAFYGNPRARDMGILGELPPEEMLAKLDEEVSAWQAADPSMIVRPALHMIAVMATGHPGADGKYRLRLPTDAIDQVMSWAEQRDAIVILDIQPGRSSVAEELGRLLPYLADPNVHLALDPEWRMQGDALPGQKVGTMHAAEVNHAIDELARLVAENGLPPKVLIVHRFTAAMLPDAGSIREDPNVQVVLNMDGWGPPSGKVNSYRSFVAPTQVAYKGFKLFYKNDTKGGSRMMTPAEVLALTPVPVYIQYQ